MKFLIISHVLHKFHDNQIWGYGPYIREMNLWEKHIDSLVVIAPIIVASPSEIDLSYQSRQFEFVEVPQFSFVGVKNFIRSVVIIPGIMFKIYTAVKQADHIHLRCPGNMGLLGALIQIFFPKKIKTTKYAGNWDWKSKQPWTNRLQQFILRNTFLTRNIQVLVYGEWPDKNKNIKPFFTASYSKNEIITSEPRDFSTKQQIKIIFVGSLIEEKRPLLSLEVVKELLDKHINCQIDFFGDGNERKVMEEYIKNNKLEAFAIFHGNVYPRLIKQAYQKSHFLIFISKSEGWPKVVAEAMFWGCFPITSAVSCVPQMLGDGSRGELIIPNVDDIVNKIKYYIKNSEEYNNKCNSAMQWSREYTLEKLESEIKKLL